MSKIRDPEFAANAIGTLIIILFEKYTCDEIKQMFSKSDEIIDYLYESQQDKKTKGA